MIDPVCASFSAASAKVMREVERAGREVGRGARPRRTFHVGTRRQYLSRPLNGRNAAGHRGRRSIVAHSEGAVSHFQPRQSNLWHRANVEAVHPAE
jgi:hypothetical protein